MTNRLEVLGMINKVMVKVKNSATRDERFTLLENVQILSEILQEVAQYEHSLIMDIDVD
jgi:hypothetical protein